MAQYDFQIGDYERIFRKRYKILIFTTVLGLVLSVIFAKMKTPLFSADATVKVDRRTPMSMGMQEMMFDTWDNIETQSSVITSFPVLLRAAKKLMLVGEDVSPESLSSNEKVLSILENMRGKIATTANSNTNVIRIQVISTVPQEARDFANAVAFAYKDFSLNNNKLNALQTKDFVQQQLDKCKDDLASAENDLETFQKSQSIPSVGQQSARTIDQAGKITEKMSAIDNAIAVIRLQQAKLERRIQTGITPMEQEKLTDSLGAAVESVAIANTMGWVSEYTDDDLGIRSLNDRLIRLQLERDDDLSFYKGDHPAVRTVDKKIVVAIREILGEYQKKLLTLEEKRKEFQKQKDSIDLEMGKLPASEMAYVRLQRNINLKEELYTLLAKRLQESMISEAGVVDDITIMSLASMPRAPINKDLYRVVFIGMFLGLIIGIIMAFFREILDTSIGTIEDVERTLKIAVLAIIPHIRTEESKGKGWFKSKERSKNSQTLPPYYRTFLVTHFNPKDPSAEAYRILRTNIEYLSFNKPLKTILVTSAAMQEGKSTTIANLAVAFAQQGKNICLLECNLRRPSLHKMFGIEHRTGISDILIEKARWQDCVMTVTDLALGQFGMEDILNVPGLDKFNMIPHGHRPPNPTELLSSGKMDQLLKETREAFDIVLVDAPPILPVADSIVLSTKVDGVILVYKAGKTPRNSLRLAKERLQTVHAKILGIALNDIRPEVAGSSYSSYIYVYGGKDKDQKSSGRKRVYTSEIRQKHS
jgi:capsular exopolysaccharide synthesis family protein